MTDEDTIEGEGAPGRHGRARTLARRRSAGESLSSYEERLLSAHLTACERCSAWVGELPTGQEAPRADTVAAVEASGSTGDGEARRDDPAAEPIEPDRGTSGDRGEDLDAMGQPKRRDVIGSGGGNKGRQLLFYGLTVAIIVGIYFGATLAISEFDVAPEKDKNAAPWAQKDAPQIPPRQFQ